MRKVIVLIGLVVGLMLIPSAAAFADAGSHASCTGIESSTISPKGTSDEFPGGRPQLNAFIREAFPGTPPGAIVSFVAHIHAGSHEGCDEATE
jgi:hypothetical protein